MLLPIKESLAVNMTGPQNEPPERLHPAHPPPEVCGEGRGAGQVPARLLKVGISINVDIAKLIIIDD